MLLMVQCNPGSTMLAGHGKIIVLSGLPYYPVSILRFSKKGLVTPKWLILNNERCKNEISNYVPSIDACYYEINLLHVGYLSMLHSLFTVVCKQGAWHQRFIITVLIYYAVIGRFPRSARLVRCCVERGLFSTCVSTLPMQRFNLRTLNNESRNVTRLRAPRGRR